MCRAIGIRIADIQLFRIRFRYSDDIQNDCPDLAKYRDTCLKARQNGRHLTDDIFKIIFFNENYNILIQIS